MSFTLLSGTLEVDVFLSQIFKFFALSLASFLFCFSVSRVMKTSSSFKRRKGEVVVPRPFYECDEML